MFRMAVLYMIDGFLRLSNLLYCNYVVQCPSEVYTVYYFICDEVCGVNRIDLDYVDFAGLSDPAVKVAQSREYNPTSHQQPTTAVPCTHARTLHPQLLPFFTKSALKTKLYFSVPN